MQQANQKCYPLESDITLTKCVTEVKLQSLLNHTADCTLFMQSEVIKNLTFENIINFSLICKWGCNRTSVQSTFKQKFSDDDDGSKSDAYIFFTSFMPQSSGKIRNHHLLDFVLP